MSLATTLLRLADTREGRGRGRHYSATRAAVESALRVLYARDWPARAWSRFPSAARVEARRLALPLRSARAESPRERARLRIGFVSDIHFGPTTSNKTIARAFDLLAEAELDVLLLGGDYVFLDATPARVAALVEQVARVPARQKFAVLGNHDLWTAHARIEAALEAASVRVLVNEHARLAPPFDDVVIVGLDDPFTGRPDAQAAFAGAGERDAAIVLCHSPSGLGSIARLASARRELPSLALYVSGHTHGGQVALPGGTPLVLPGGRWARRFPHGLAMPAQGTGLPARMPVFVSRGLGGVEIPIRAFAPPDVAIFEFTDANRRGATARPVA